MSSTKPSNPGLTAWSSPCWKSFRKDLTRYCSAGSRHEREQRALPALYGVSRSQGFLTVIHDHRGHGASVRHKRDLGYMYGGGAEALLEDIYLINDDPSQKISGAPADPFRPQHGFPGRTELCERARRLRGCPYRLRFSLQKSGPPHGRVPGKSVEAALWRPPCVQSHRVHFLRPYVARFADEKNKFAWVCSDRKVVEPMRLLNSAALPLLRTLIWRSLS